MIPLHQSRGLEHRSTRKCSSFGNSLIHVCQWVSSCGTGLSQANFLLQRSCRSFLARRTKGARNPSGSYTELMMDNSPLLVAGLSLMVMLKLKVSEATSHQTPSTLSIIGRLKSRFLTTVACSASGMASTTFQEFDSHFVRRNHLFAGALSGYRPER